VPTSSRVRALVLSLLATMLAGSVMAGAASAEAGPFWHHRAVGGKGEGEKIEPKAPENFSGSGGVQTFMVEITPSLTIEFASAATQVKGAFFNNEHQGQAKIVIFYQKPEIKINGEKRSECKIAVGQQGQFNDILQLKGHLAWKWNGNKTQLEEAPQREQTWGIAFTQTEPQEQSGRPLLDMRTGSGVFAEIAITGRSCGALGGILPIMGSEVALPSPRGLGEFTKRLTIRTIPSGLLPHEILGNEVEGQGLLQHLWVGGGYQPLILGLTDAGGAASITGQTEIEAAQQEMAVVEK